MANIGGYKGWHLCAEVTGRDTSSISVKAWIHADSGYSCAWGARTMTVTCNGKTQSKGINKMNNSGNANSNVVYFTFDDLASGTGYRINFSYDVRATLSKVYQDTWTGYLDSSTTTVSYWNDINAYNPDRTAQNGLVFDLSTSDGGRWYNITNEPSDFTKTKGTTATVSNIRSNVTGAHYSGNNVTNSTASSFTWTFNSANWVCEIYTSWNTYYRDINAYQPDGSNQGGLMFDYYIYNRNGQLVDVYYNVINEVAGTVTREYGYTCTINNIRPNVTGAHYTYNNITGNGAGSFSYTFNVESAACLYSAWNTYTVTFNANGGTGTTADQGFTYNTAQNLRSNGFSRPGYDFLGWSTSSTATTATYYNGQSVSNLTATHGGVVTLYAVWRETKPSNVQLTGTVTGPFGIDLSYSSTGLNVSYTVYYKKSTESNYTSVSTGSATSTSLAVAEETTYNIYVAATNKGGTTDSNTITLTTPADQAKIRIKKDGVWKKGKTYYKKDGVWVKAKKLYIKIDGKWVINTNYDPGEKR